MNMSFPVSTVQLGMFSPAPGGPIGVAELASLPEGTLSFTVRAAPALFGPGRNMTPVIVNGSTRLAGDAGVELPTAVWATTTVEVAQAGDAVVITAVVPMTDSR